jgi:hypothetical protein
VTPFDPVALYAMLLSFYQLVSASELARARRERPDYFAAGTLGGSKGDKLFLPDTRVFDLIQNAGGLPGTQRWQVIEAGPGGPGDPWPLEAGPLTPLEDVTPSSPGNVRAFEARVASALGDLGPSDAALGQAEQQLVAGADRAQQLENGGGELDDVDRAVEEIHHTRSADELADIISQADGIDGGIDSTVSDYDEAPPEPQAPADPPMPAQPPPDDSGGEPGREDPDRKTHPENPNRPDA